MPSYGGPSVELSSVNYPTPGCWQVNARSGAATLSFVALVIYEPAASNGPVTLPAG